MKNIFFNAFHAPIGAHATFTLGCKGKSGGIAVENALPARENVFIGCEDAAGKTLLLLPFADSELADDSARFDHMAEHRGKKHNLAFWPDCKIGRDYQLGCDTFTAEEFSCRIFSPVMSVPDPAAGDTEALKFAIAPAIILELELDNRRNSIPRKVFFAQENSRLNDGYHTVPGGIMAGRTYGIFSDNGEAIQNFGIEKALTDQNMMLGQVGGIAMEVAPGSRATLRLAIVFYRAGIVTTGLECSYYYTRFFPTPESVGEYALANFERYRKTAGIEMGGLNPARRFQLIHAIRSYYGSTQFLQYEGKPLWVVNEGEYRMMNTFDLVVDQLFYELKMNPWTVRNVLDLFVDRYSYTDKLHAPGEENRRAGGLTFTHDMGTHNQFSRPGHSSYELGGLDGCFSHMSAEQLHNWILCAALYAKQCGMPEEWRPVFKQCFESLVNRCSGGIVAFDSSRTLDGAEITTYDSLDVSLGQARNNGYLAVKTIACFVAFADLFPELAESARHQAKIAAQTICASADSEGKLPAIIGEPCHSHIIPVIEGLVFPYRLGLWNEFQRDFADLLATLQKHLLAVLNEKYCLYPDGGWKLSSSADNSWLSKIYLCQFVAGNLLAVPAEERADIAHMNWLLNDENLPFAWSDQMTGGIARGSKYYPRGVTAILWTK